MRSSDRLIAEVIAIGDEMTSGARVDTNSAWISQQLATLGIPTLFHTTVADELAAGIDCFQTAARRADVIIATGGLGPTQDDLTRQVLASATGQPLEFCPEVMEHIQRVFTKRGRPMPDRNRIQAMFPAGSRVIDNPQGTAPGIDIEIRRDGVERDSSKGGARVFALPGVPAEMKQMFTATVQQRLITEMSVGEEIIRQHVVKCFGLGESEMESILGDMISRDHIPTVGITVSRATISLRITARGSSEAETAQSIAATAAKIQRAASDYIFGEGELYELQHAVAERLQERKQRLATIELGAACPISQWMASVNENGIYTGGVHAESLQFVALPAESGQDMKALLSGFADRAAADWVLVVDRYPRIPFSDQPLPAFPLRISILPPNRTSLQTLPVELGGHPDIIHSRIGKTALDFLRRQWT